MSSFTTLIETIGYTIYFHRPAPICLSCFELVNIFGKKKFIKKNFSEIFSKKLQLKGLFKLNFQLVSFAHILNANFSGAPFRIMIPTSIWREISDFLHPRPVTGRPAGRLFTAPAGRPAIRQIPAGLSSETTGRPFRRPFEAGQPAARAAGRPAWQNHRPAGRRPAGRRPAGEKPAGRPAGAQTLIIGRPSGAHWVPRGCPLRRALAPNPTTYDGKSPNRHIHWTQHPK